MTAKPISLAALGPAITKAVQAGVAGAIQRGIARCGVEISDRVRVATGANRRTTTASSGQPDVVSLSRDQHYPPKSRGDFEAEISGLEYGNTAYIAQGQPYSAVREKLDGAVEAGISATESAWKPEGEAAWPPTGGR